MIAGLQVGVVVESGPGRLSGTRGLASGGLLSLSLQKNLAHSQKNLSSPTIRPAVASILACA